MGRSEDMMSRLCCVLLWGVVLELGGIAIGLAYNWGELFPASIFLVMFFLAGILATSVTKEFWNLR